jgi:hypothetical protein
MDQVDEEIRAATEPAPAPDHVEEEEEQEEERALSAEELQKVAADTLRRERAEGYGYDVSVLAAEQEIADLYGPATSAMPEEERQKRIDARLDEYAKADEAFAKGLAHVREHREMLRGTRIEQAGWKDLTEFTEAEWEQWFLLGFTRKEVALAACNWFKGAGPFVMSRTTDPVLFGSPSMRITSEEVRLIEAGKIVVPWWKAPATKEAIF